MANLKNKKMATDDILLIDNVYIKKIDVVNKIYYILVVCNEDKWAYMIR